MASYARFVMVDDVDGLQRRFTNLTAKTRDEIASFYDFTIRSV